MKKRLLSAILSFCMLLTMAPTVAFAADGDDEAAPQINSVLDGSCGAAGSESSVTWKLTQNNEDNENPTYTLTISGSGDMANYDVGKAPWHVALGAKGNRKQINKIELPSGLTRIGDNAFLQASVTDVKIPDTVISIGTNAFWNCNTIQTTIPASVQELGATAFYGTFVVNVDANSPYFYSEEDGKILYNKDKTTLYQVSQDCTGNFTIPSTVTTINDFAMNGCAKVTGELVIPDSVQTIGRSAFEGTGFTSLNLGNSVKEIGVSAFYNCATMTGNLVIPASVTTIGKNAFAKTGFNGKLDFQAQIEEFPAAIFKELNFTSVSFSDSVKTIGDHAFENCKLLTTVTFGQGLETIGSFAFEGSGISGKLIFPDSLKRIKDYAFSNCLGITEIDFPEGNATIEYAAFTGDTGVQKIKIPLSEIQFDKLNNGGYWIFTQYKENKLETIVVGTAPKENSMSLFANSLAGLKTIVIGTGVSEINNYAFQNSTSLESALYPSDLVIDNVEKSNQKLIDVGTKYTVAANGSMGQNTEQAMLTFETPEGKTCPAVTYLSTNESAVTVDENGKIKAVGSVGQKATIKAQYDGTTFAKVDVTIGTSAGEDFYSIDPVIADQTYTGTELKPAVKVTKNGKEITEGFTVKYDNNTNVGTATATVKVGDTVIGTATFNIVKATPSITISATPDTLTGGGSVELTVSGVPTEGKLSVTCDNNITVTEKDGKYTAQLPNATKDYTFTAKYTGMDNYNDVEKSCKVSVTYKGSSHHSSSTSNTVSASTASNGKVSLDKSTAKKGDTVTVTVTPDAGYQLDKLTVTDVKGKTVDVTKKSDGKYTFTMPDSKVTITPTFSKIEDTKPSKNGFDDVASSDWFADAVKYVADKGLMNGTDDNQFSPSASTTRGMLMTVLARYAGEDTTGGATWYEKGMEWAKAKGVSDGTNPNANITREQLVTMMYRYAGSPATNGSLDNFSDAASVSSYAANAMQWAVENGIVNGSNDKLNPQDNATRAQVAAILMRFCEMSK